MPVPARPTRAATITVSNLRIWFLRDVLMQCTFNPCFSLFLAALARYRRRPRAGAVRQNGHRVPLFEAPRRLRNMPFGPDLAVFTPTAQSGRKQARRRI